MRITDVSPDAQERTVRQRTEKRLEEMGVTRNSLYVPEYLLRRLSPEQRREAERYNALREWYRTN